MFVKKNRFPIVLGLLLNCMTVSAVEADSLSLLQKTQEQRLLRQVFQQEAWQNPALMQYRYRHSLSSLSVGGGIDRFFEDSWLQEGTGWKGFQVDADSYIRLSPDSRAYGEAGYQRGVRRDVQWNETSDYDRLYPYVAADTLGGDMTSETYSFKGGYSHQLGKWTLGGELSYRALLEFRKVDPRPKNSIADLRVAFGASYAVHPKYAVALQLEGQKYKQNCDIRYFNELGVCKTFHLQGLGMSYSRFDGTRTQTNYEGSVWKGGLQLFPLGDRGGWTASFSASHSGYDKSLPSLNDLVLNKLNDNLLQASLGYLYAGTRQQWGVKVRMENDRRTGKELIYGDAANNLYPFITERTGYRRKMMLAGMSAFWQRTSGNSWMYGSMLNLSWVDWKENQYSSLNRQSFSNLDLVLLLTASKQWKKDGLSLDVQFGYQPNLSADLKVYTTTGAYAKEILNRNFRYICADKVDYQLSVRWSHQVARKALAYLQAGWGQRHDSSRPAGTGWEVSVGTFF